MVWKDTVRLTPVFKSEHIITCSVLMEGQEEEFFCSFIYASNDEVERRDLWEDLRIHHNSPIFRNKKWIIFGDFNEILVGDEHSSYANNPTIAQGTRDFQSLAQHCLLTYMSYQGPMYTWCNKREEGLICKKLDRVLISDGCLQSFPRSYSVFDSRGCSDHLRCRVVFDTVMIRVKRPFKFVNAIATLPSLTPKVEEFWSDTDDLFHSTSALFRFSKKL